MNIITLIIPYIYHFSIVLALQSNPAAIQDWQQHINKPFSVNSARCDRELIIEAEDGTKARVIVPNGMTVSIHGDEGLKRSSPRTFKDNIEVRIFDLKPEHYKTSRIAREVMSHSQIVIKVDKGLVKVINRGE